MYRIVKKEALKPTVILYEIEAPMVAKKAEPGQFIILRVDENGERIPITIHDFDREKGTVTIIVQTIGATTEKLRHKAEGEYIQDFVGPLGRPTETAWLSSSISGMTSIAEKEVWRRALASKGDTRTRRWTPFSPFRKP